MLVVVVDELDDLVLEVAHGSERAASDSASRRIATVCSSVKRLSS